MGIKITALIRKTFVFLTFIFFIIISSPLSAEEIKQGNEFNALIQKLIHDGFEKNKIEQLFSNDNVFFNPEGVSRFFIHTESSLNYDQFLSKKSIANAFKYMDEHQDALNRAQKIYSVASSCSKS